MGVKINHLACIVYAPDFVSYVNVSRLSTASKIIEDIGKYTRKTTTDLPLILILSVYTDFLPFELGKILIFFLKI